ncbi:hypothetical protein D3C72_1750840 [compost metagenome]
MLVGHGRQFVHQSAGQSAQPGQVGQQVGVQGGGQITPAERLGIRVRIEQVQPAGVRNGRGGGGNGHDGVIHGGILAETGDALMVGGLINPFKYCFDVDQSKKNIDLPRSNEWIWIRASCATSSPWPRSAISAGRRRACTFPSPRSAMRSGSWKKTWARACWPAPAATSSSPTPARCCTARP